MAGASRRLAIARGVRQHFPEFLLKLKYLLTFDVSNVIRNYDPFFWLETDRTDLEWFPS